MRTRDTTRRRKVSVLVAAGVVAGVAMSVAAQTGDPPTMSLVPIGNGPFGELDPGVRIEGDEIILPRGGTTVFLEVRIGDWDPDDIGVRLRAYGVALDFSGFTSGLTCRSW